MCVNFLPIEEEEKVDKDDRSENILKSEFLIPLNESKTTVVDNMPPKLFALGVRDKLFKMIYGTDEVPYDFIKSFRISYQRRLQKRNMKTITLLVYYALLQKH